MQSFIDLLKDHTLILAATRSLLLIVEGDTPAPGQAHDALRRLARQLDAHLRAEAQFLETELADRQSPFAALNLEHGKRFDNLVAEWSIYLREWTEENIAADWLTFAQDTRWILAELNAQVEAENRSLYPAALQYGLIRLIPEDQRRSAVA